MEWGILYVFEISHNFLPFLCSSKASVKFSYVYWTYFERLFPVFGILLVKLDLILFRIHLFTYFLTNAQKRFTNRKPQIWMWFVIFWQVNGFWAIRGLLHMFFKQFFWLLLNTYRIQIHCLSHLNKSVHPGKIV